MYVHIYRTGQTIRPTSISITSSDIESEMDQSVGESPNATTVEETECSVTAGPTGATTEKNGGANDDVDDYADDGSNDDFDGVDDIDGAAAGPPNVVCVDGAVVWSQKRLCMEQSIMRTCPHRNVIMTVFFTPQNAESYANMGLGFAANVKG